MKWFRVPYRWLPRTFFKNVKSILEDLFWYGPRNVIRWVPVIWFDCDFDYSSTLDVMAYKLERLGVCLENGLHVNGKRDGRRVKTAAYLCRRLSEGNYYKNADKRFPGRGRAWAEHITATKQQDKEMLGHLIGKYIDHWWD